jgi:hypothetical protein
MKILTLDHDNTKIVVNIAKTIYAVSEPREGTTLTRIEMDSGASILVKESFAEIFDNFL